MQIAALGGLREKARNYVSRDVLHCECLFPSQSEYCRRVQRGVASGQRRRQMRTDGRDASTSKRLPTGANARVRHYAYAALDGSARKNSRGVCRHNLLCGVQIPATKKRAAKRAEDGEG